MSLQEGALGREYADKEVVCHQGDKGDCMYMIQSGKAEVLRQEGDSEMILGELTQGDIFGEMSLFEKRPRSATVRVKGKTRILTLDRRMFMKRIHEDPSLAFNILQKMSQRIRSLDDELGKMRKSHP